MREGLRSGVKLLAKPDKGKVSPSPKTVKVLVDRTEKEARGSTFENASKLLASGTEEDKLTSAAAEEKATDGSKCHDSGAGGDIGENGVADCTPRRSKRNRIDELGEKGVDSAKKQKVKGGVVGGKVLVVARVLRSRSTLKPESEETVEKGQKIGGFEGEQTEEEDGSDKKRATMKEEGGKHMGGETVEKGPSNDGLVEEKTAKTGGSEKKRVVTKEEDNDHLNCEDGGKVQVVGRVLRSRSALKSTGEETVEKGQSTGDFVGENTGEKDESEEKRVMKEEEGDGVHLDGEHSFQSGDMTSDKLVRKRGRPRKTPESEVQKQDDVDKGYIDQHAVKKNCKKLKRKRGRPPKPKENDESAKKRGNERYNQHKTGSENLKRRRGRPPKVQKDESWKKLGDAVGKGMGLSVCQDSHQPSDEEFKKLKPRRGRPPKIQESQLFEKENALSEKRFIGKEYGRNTMPAKKMKCNKDKDTGKTKQDAGELGHHSRIERQAVRDKIVDLLLGAGWEIQYRPREGREYKDAVYVNPEGRTHWSVTLAYRMLKKQYEDDGTISKACKSNFKFTPIPDEELNVLTKVMSKVRSDKNKKKKKRRRNLREKGENLIEVISTKKKWKLQRRKLGAAAAGVGRKLLKGRAKPKSLHNKNDELAFAPDRGTAVPVRGRKRLEMQGRKRCGLMVRNSQEGTESDSNGYVLYTGKRTVLSWMLGLGTVSVDEKVQYLKCRKTRGALKGRITSDGILCDCCNKTFTIAEFEIHAGGKSSLPFKNILLDSGSSLLQCQLDSWHKQDESAHKGFHFVDIEGEDPNDDTCGVCGDGGDLICCDSCPSTFHQSCLEIKKFPSGRWHCIFCLCKLCGETGVSTWQRDDSNAAILGSLLTCCLCEEKYHRQCVQAKEALNDDDPGSSSFCGKKCQELHEKLQKLFGVKHELEEGFSWTFVRRFDVGLDISLSGMPQKIECNSKVAVALLLMDECFLPMVDQRSGVNLIRNIVYNFGSNFNRLNYSGFFTAILERGDEMIAAASIRIHGNHLAEMPFIGTRYMYRRQGMCRRLLSAIEMGLSSLDVEKLVIPAISELRETWTSVFGFKPLEGSSKQVLSNVNMMVFPGVDMLQKTLLKYHFAVESMNLMEESTELGEHTKEDVENKSDECCSAEFDLKDSSGVGSCYSVNNKIKELAAVETGSLIPDVCLNDATIQIANTLACPNSGMTSNDLGERNKSIASPLDLSSDGCERSGSEMKNNIADKYSTGFELKASCDTGAPHASTAICESAEAESGSLVPDGCLNNGSDIIIQVVNSSKYHVHSEVISENMDVRNENTENPRDFLCDSHEQTGNEMIRKFEEKDLARIGLHASSKTNASDFSKIIGETCAPELGLLHDGYLNAASDPTTLAKCHDHSGVGSGNLDGKIQNVVNPLVSSCDTWEKAAKCTGQKSALSATSDLPTDNALPPFPVQLNQHNLSEVENKPCAASHIMSGVATCGGGMPCASSDNIVAVSCEVKIEDNDVKQNLKNTGEDYMHVITEGVSTQSQDLIFENGKVSDGDIVQPKSSTCNNSCNVQSTSPTACQKLQDASKGHFAALPAEQNCGSSKINGPTCDHLCHAAAFDTTVKPTLQTSVRVCDLKEVSAAAISNGISLDEGVVSDGADVNAESSKLPGPDSEVDNDAEQL